MQIVVLCGGEATRLYPLTERISKSMIEIQGKPFLEHQIDLFKKNKILDIVLCTGFLSEQIEEYFGNGEKFGVNIKYSQEKEKLDTGGALKNAVNLLNDEFFIIYGDSYLTINYQTVYNHFKESNKLGLVTVYENRDQLEPSNIIVKDKLIQKYDKVNHNQPEMVYVEYGLNIFKKNILDLISKKTFPISDYFKKLIAEKELVSFKTSQRFYEIGSFKGLEQTKDLISKKLVKST